MNDDLSGVLPGRRFITIHPDLLDIMGYYEAALIHEIRWRAVADKNEWVTLAPSEWEATLHLTTKQVRRAVDICVEAGWIEVDKQGDSRWDHTRSFRLSTGAIRSALQGNSMRPGGQIRFALQGDSSYTQEPLQEVLPDASLSASAVAVSNSSTSPPHPAPPVKLFQDDILIGTIITREQFEHMDAGARRMVLDSLGHIAPARPTKEAADIPASPAPSAVEESSRLNVIRRPESLLRALKQGHEWEPSNQADQRNVAKLLDLKPTLSQLDGAIEVVRAECDGRLDLGRLVTKWSTYSQFGLTRKRPERWQTPRKREQDAAEAHVAAGGNPYMRDGKIDYGI